MNKKIIIGCSVVIIVGALITVNVVRSSGSTPAFGGGKAVSVSARKIEKGNIFSTVSASGVVEEISKSEVYFETPLKVQKVLVSKNQKVSKGQKLIELDMDSLNSELTQLKLTKATQELSLQRTQTQDSIRSVAALEAALAVAQNNLASARKNLDESRKNLGNSEVLFKAGAISESEFDRAKRAVVDAEIAVKNAEHNANSSADNLEETKKSNSQVSSSKNIDVETQRKNLEATNLRISDLEKRIKKILDNTISPVDGVVTERNVEDGGFTSNVQPAFRIVNPEKLQIKADIKEFHIKNIAVGQKVNISGDALGKDTVVEGKISAVSPVAKKNRTASGEETLIEVIISIEKSNPVLKPGLSVTCDVITSEKDGVLVGSFEMFNQDKDENKFVFVYNEKDGIISQKFVKLGITSDLNVEIVEGLNVGDMVVTNPKPSYKDGTKAKLDEKKK